MIKHNPVSVFTSFFIVLILLVSALFVFSGCNSSDSNTSENTTDTKQDIMTETLFTRYLESLHLLMNKPDILVGELPSTLPFDLPLPDDTDIIGSVIQSFGQDDIIDIILSASGEPENIIAFYRDNLTDNGWIELESDSSSSSGFSPPITYGQAEFCREVSPNIALMVTTIGVNQDDPIDLRLTIHTNIESFECSVSREDRYIESQIILPTLNWPEGARAKSSSGGGGSDDRYAGMTLKTDVIIEELETHFKDQLIEDGWVLEYQGDSDTVIWNSLTKNNDSGGEWVALMVVHELGDDVKSIYIQADRIQ